MSKPPNITDSHCHLDFPQFDGELPDLLARAAERGVHRMVTICTKLRAEPDVRAIAEANAPIFLWLVLGGWWALLILGFAYLQRMGKALDTYQAIWGPDPELPGNQREPIAFPGLKPKQLRDRDDEVSPGE